MRLGTCNSQNNPDLPRHKVKKIAAVAGVHTDVCGFQEIRELEDVEDTIEGLGPRFELYNTQTSVPIAFNTTIWNVLDVGFNTLSPASAKLTPQRYVSWAIAEHRRREELGPVAFTNGHQINKAWNGKEEDALLEIERRAYWNQGWNVWDATVEELRKQGLPVFIVGDFNKLEVDEFHRKQIWLDNKGIDKIAFVPGPRKSRSPDFKLKTTYTINTPSDHHLNVVEGRLVP